MNSSGYSTRIRLKADQIYIGTGSSQTTLAGLVSVEDGHFSVLTDANFHGDVAFENMATQITSTGGVYTNKVRISGPAPGEVYTLDSTSVSGLHASASIASDTLTVGKFGGGNAFTIQKSGNNLLISDGTSTITFSKAIAPTITGDWNGGILHVSTSPSAVADLYYYLSQQSETWSDTTVSIPIGYATGQHDPVAGTAYTASLNVSGKLYAGSYSSNGLKTPPSGYIGFSSVDINVPSGSHSISASVQSGTFATRQDMEEEYPGHSWSSIGSVSTGYRAVKITCGSATKWVFYVGT